MIEPRSAEREDFDGLMKAFYEVVKGDLNSSYLSEGKVLQNLDPYVIDQSLTNPLIL